jgi:hypothetical protein
MEKDKSEFMYKYMLDGIIEDEDIYNRTATYGKSVRTPLQLVDVSGEFRGKKEKDKIYNKSIENTYIPQKQVNTPVEYNIDYDNTRNALATKKKRRENIVNPENSNRTVPIRNRDLSFKQYDFFYRLPENSRKLNSSYN